MITIKEVLQLLISEEFKNEIEEFTPKAILEMLEVQVICNLHFKEEISFEDAHIRVAVIFEKNEVTIQSYIEHILDVRNNPPSMEDFDLRKGPSITDHINLRNFEF